jgi:putative hydrolase
MIELCKKYNFPIIIGSDAHVATKIGEDKNIREYYKYLGLSKNVILNNNLIELLKWIKR